MNWIEWRNFYLIVVSSQQLLFSFSSLHFVKKITGIAMIIFWMKRSNSKGHCDKLQKYILDDTSSPTVIETFTGGIRLVNTPWGVPSERFQLFQHHYNYDYYNSLVGERMWKTSLSELLFTDRFEINPRKVVKCKYNIYMMWNLVLRMKQHSRWKYLLI